MTGGVPPNDEIAEQAALGAMLISKQAAVEVAALLKPEDFYFPKHADIFRAATSLLTDGEPVDQLTVATELAKRGKIKRGGDGTYLLTIAEQTPFPGHAKHYAQTVLEKARLRRMAELGTRLQQLAYSGASTTDEVNALMSEGESLFRDHHEPDDRSASMADLIKSWEAFQEKAESVIRTPWDGLNRMLNGGLRRGGLYIFAGRPGAGKSVGILNVAEFAAQWSQKTALFSLEMGKDEVMSRMLAAGASADLGQIMRKQMDLETSHRVAEYINRNRDLPIEVIDRERITVEQIVSHCRSLGKLDVVAVDYLQLLTATDSKVSREQQVSHFSRSLKIAARELNVAMVVGAQLNRGSVKDGKPRAPTIGDLRESGALEQDADVVFLLHNDEDDPGIVRLIVGKNRNGKTGDLVLNFEGRYTRIT